jgi:hypothetical protein
MQESHFLNYDQFLPKKASAPNLFHCVECKKPGILRGEGGRHGPEGERETGPERERETWLPRGVSRRQGSEG